MKYYRIMQSATIALLKKPVFVRFSGKTIDLPSNIKNKIDTYWQKLIDEGKKYSRNEIFTVTKYEETKDTIEILVEKTDYAHYVYNKDVGGLGPYEVRVIHAAAIVVTEDKRLVFGQMGEQTARANLIQLAGGGLDMTDLRGDLFDLDHSVQKELLEELDIDVTDKNRVVACRPTYFKSGGEKNVLTVIYRVELNESAETFKGKYDVFVQQVLSNHQKPEFAQVYIISLDAVSLGNFLKEHGTQCVDLAPLFDLLLLN